MVRRGAGLAGLALPGAVLLAVGLALPLAMVVIDSVWTPEPGIGAYLGVLADPLVTDALLRTFYIAAVVTVVTLLSGYVIALTAWRSSALLATVILMAASFPVLTSVVMRNFAWTIVLGRKGPLNELLIATGLISQPLQLLNTSSAVIVSMVHVMLPFAVFPIFNALRKIDPALLRASAACGASPIRTFRNVTLPLSAAGGAVAGVFVFVLSLGFFVAPALLGGPKNAMVANVIDKEANFYLDFDRAAAIAMVLLVVVGLLLVAAARRTNLSRVLRG